MKKSLIISTIVGTLSLIAVSTAVFGAILVLATNYGTRIKFDHGDVYYTENVTEVEAESLVRVLNSIPLDASVEVAFQLDRKLDAAEDTILVRMCSKPLAWETDELDEAFQETELLIQTEAFPKSNVVFELCDSWLQTKKVIDNTPMTK